jgi:GNAT superfamily N-acetyltransferase
MITLEYFEVCNRTPAMPLMARGWSELIRGDLADPVQVINWDDEAILALVNGDPAGVMSFSHIKWERVIWVKLGYVLPEFRRQGVYRAMWNRLVEIAQQRKVPEILGATSVRNAAMQKTMHRLGRTAFALQYRYKVVDKND